MHTASIKSLAPILAAEDEETDGVLLQVALAAAHVPNPLVIVPDGKLAVDYLSGAPPYADRTVHPLPSLVLLDLKMPRMTGFDVLEWLSRQPQFRDTPVVVLSSSLDKRDIDRARQLGAWDYFVKPHDYRGLTGMLRQLAERWLGESPNIPIR